MLKRPETNHVIGRPMRGLNKNCMGRGQGSRMPDRPDRRIAGYGQTSRLLDQIAPVGRFGEKREKKYFKDFEATFRSSRRWLSVGFWSEYS